MYLLCNCCHDNWNGVFFFPISTAAIVKETNSFNKSPIPQCLWLPNLAGWWGTLLALSHKVTQPFGHVVLQDHVTNQNHYICTTTLPITTKLGTMVNYVGGFLTIKPHDPFNTWSCWITWLTKTIISPLPQYLWPPNVASWWLSLRGFHLDSQMSF